MSYLSKYLAKQFLGTHGPATVGSKEEGIIDAILSVGLWLERSKKVFSRPLEDEDFLRHLQTLSLLSANHSSPTTRYIAHSLTPSILHAHPKNNSRLTFITDTLENCPYEGLKASAVAWLDTNRRGTPSPLNGAGADDVLFHRMVGLEAR